MPYRAYLPKIIRLLYNHNPFYVISAACIIYTLKLAFRPGEVAYIDPWALMASLGGYTLLMAVTGYLVVKLGRVWEDARTIFLVLLLLFLATSVTFDELLNLNRFEGKMLIYSGFALAVFVTEGLLLGLTIRLAVLFRVPYYLWLVLLYFFPIGVSPEVTGLDVLSTSWRLLAFPVLAGGVGLALLPAVRRGAAYCSRNGTPWGWPLYPWCLFVFIALATLVRTYALTISFLPSDGMDTAFQPYFLIPFLFSVLILLFEMGLVENRPKLIHLVLNVSPALLLLAVPNTRQTGPSAVFLDSLIARLGSPLWLTVLGLAGFYAMALIRRVPGIQWRLLSTILALIWIGPQTVNGQTFSAPSVWPLAVIGLFELVQAIRHRRSLPALVGSLCLAGALSIWMWDSQWLQYRRIIPYHVALASVLIIGGMFQDRFARTLRIVGAALLPTTAAVSLIVADGLVFSNLTWGLYLTSLASVTVGCWFWTRDRAFLYALLTMIIAACCESIFLSAMWLKRVVGVRVLVPLVLGVISFLLAIAISALKAGVGYERLKRWGILQNERSSNF